MSSPGPSRNVALGKGRIIIAPFDEGGHKFSTPLYRGVKRFRYPFNKGGHKIWHVNFSQFLWPFHAVKKRLCPLHSKWQVPLLFLDDHWPCFLFYWAMSLCNNMKVLWLWWYTPRYRFLPMVLNCQVTHISWLRYRLFSWSNLSRLSFD